MSQNVASHWYIFLAFAPAFAVLILAIVEGWKLIDEVNVAIPWQERYRRWGKDPVRAWEKHILMFPERAALRRRIRWLYGGSFGLLAVAVASCFLWK